MGQPFPSMTPILTPQDELHPAWREFFYNLWLRTGGPTESVITPGGGTGGGGGIGSDPVITIELGFGLEFDEDGAIAVDFDTIDHNELLNYEFNRHYDHSLLLAEAGLGLSGGGDLTASFTYTLDFSTLPSGTPSNVDLLAFRKDSDELHYTVPVGDLLGSGTIITRVAAAAITANRVIMQQTDGEVRHADAGNLADAWSIIGISVANAASGADVQIKMLGDLTHSGMTLGPLYCGLDGELESTALAQPIAEFTRRVGAALSATALWSERGDVTELTLAADDYLLNETGGTLILEDASGVLLLE
jgi:hypothetical protein